MITFTFLWIGPRILLPTKVRTWEENYGNRKSDFTGSCMEGLRIIFKVDLHLFTFVLVIVCYFFLFFQDEKILLLGCVQSLLESCMYIFVFLWTPVLDTGATPLGMVFSCFMVSTNSLIMNMLCP